MQSTAREATNLRRTLVFWDHTKMARCKCAPGAGSRGKNAKLLLKKAGRVDGLVVSDQKLINQSNL